MMKYCLLLFSFFLFQNLFAQKIELNNSNISANKVYVTYEMLDKYNVLKVIKDSTVKAIDEPTFARIKELNDFQNGVIEVTVLSRLSKTASLANRGFIGVSFRINEDNSAFECIYIRPTNGRAEDQIRRNHSIQYFSYPDYKFPRLRKETPEKYESYADMGLNEWIKIRIEVNNQTAKLFLNDVAQPSLIVNDLKLGEENRGGIGLFVDVGTEGYFRDLKISKQ